MENERQTAHEAFGIPKRRSMSRRVIGAVAAIAVAAVGMKAVNFLEKSGEYQTYPPVEEKVILPDNRYNVISWNMHNETAKRIAELKKIAEKKDIDAFVLQEVNTRDSKILKQNFPEWQTTYFLADTRQEILSRGFGNVIMTKHKQKDIDPIAIEGNSAGESGVKMALGAVIDFWNEDREMTESRKALLENRVIGAVTVEVPTYWRQEPQDIRLITAHIAGGEANDSQMGKVLEYVNSNAKEDRPTIFLGDLNRDPEDVIPEFANIKFIVPVTESTSVTSGRTIDYGAYQMSRVLGVGEAEVLYSHKTDHYAYFGSWAIRQAEEQ